MTIIFWISLSILVYTFVGYPLFLQVMRILSRPVLKVNKAYNKPISVVMVVCNEQEVVLNKIKNIFNQDYRNELINLVIIDDCSDDNTVSLIESYTDNKIILLKNSVREGKAVGINKGMEYVSTELVLFVDARQKISSNTMQDLSSWFVNKSQTIAVSGEVKFECKSSEKSGMDAYQKYERNIRYNESCVLSVPGVSGAIYMLRVSSFRPIVEDTILDDVLIPMQGAESGGWVGFDERAVAWDMPSDDWEREKKRKTRTLNGNYQLLFRNLHWCLPGGHPFWFQYLSHKVLRLTAPIFTLFMIVASFNLGVDGSFYALIFGLLVVSGILLYPLSLYLPVINRFTIFRIGTSFVALNWFNLIGLFQYLFVSKRQSWK